MATAAAPGTGRVRPRWFELVRLVPLVLLIGFVLWLGEVHGGDRKWMDLGTEAFYIAAAVIGLNVLLGFTGLLSLGHAAFLAVGGYAGAIWAAEWGLSPWAGFAVAFVAGSLTGAVLALLSCHLRGFYLTVVTLAFGALLPPVVTVFDSLLGGITGRAVAEPLDVQGVPLADGDVFVGLYYVAAVVLLVALLLAWNLSRSRWGRAYMAIRESEIAAKASGVNTYLTKVTAFALSAGIVSMAGVVAAQRFLLVSPSVGSSDQSFRLVIMVAMGGMGTIAGPVLAAFGLSFGFGITWVQDHFSNYQGLLFGGLALFTVATAPEGTVPNLRRLVHNAALRRARAGHPGWVRAIPPPSGTLGFAQLPLRARSEGDAGGVLLDVEELTKRFGGLAALDGLDLAVRRGSIHGLIGPNGSGKSTFVNVITGFYEESDGAVRLGGQSLSGLPSHQRARRGIARTFQNLQIWPKMSVLENVMVGVHDRERVGLLRSVLGLGWREERRMRSRAWDLLHVVGLAASGHQPAGSLPFADQRRLEIARALAADPDLLLLDEPAAGMHPAEVHELVHLIRMVRDAGITVLLIEHHMDVVMELCDTVTVLDYGRKIAEAAPDEIRTDPVVVEAYLGAPETVG